MKSRVFVLGTILAAAMPLWAETARNPRGSVALDALEPGALAARVRAAPAAGDPREWYFVVVKGPDPDFAAIGATLEASWKNRRLVRVPPQAVKGLARHPDVLYLQRTEKPGASGQASATSNFEATAEAMPGPVSATSEIGSLTWTTGEYAYDGAGNVKSIGPDHWGKTQEYRYDGVGRLINATAHTKLANHTEGFAYDVFGNLTSKTTDGEIQSQPVCPPAPQVCTTTNRLSGASYDYDEAGNLIGLGSSEYRWDGGGMLNEMWYGTTGQNGYVYTPDDERIGVVTGGIASTYGGTYWTWTIRDFGGKVIREFESRANEGWAEPWFWVEDYAHGLGRVLVSEREAANGGRRHYHADHLGTTRLVTTDDGFTGVTAGDGYYISEHVYYPFGIEATPLLQEHAQGNDRETRLKYTGHERDYLGGELAENTNQLDYMHARYYNPNLGRFLSVDPGGVYPDRPQTWNRYAYVSNNPILKLDPDGRDEFVFVWKPGVDAVGHAAIGVQNRGANGRPDGTVTVRHLWPAEPVGKSLEAPADYRTDVINESDLMKFQGGEGKAADGILRIKGDAKQDGSVLGALAKADNNPKYTGPSNTCSTFCAAGVQATGIKMTQTGNVKVTVGGLTVKEQSGVITPIAVYNSVVSSKDPRVTVVKALPDRDPNLTIKY